MSVTIIGPHRAKERHASDVQPGDWISDGTGPVWHQVLEIDSEHALIGDSRANAVVVDVDPDGWIYVLHPDDRPRNRW